MNKETVIHIRINEKIKKRVDTIVKKRNEMGNSATRSSIVRFLLLEGLRSYKKKEK